MSELKPSRDQTILISMVRNEIGVIADFMAHALALFDKICIADHQSDDGTAEFLAELARTHPQVELWRFEEPGYYQSEVINWMVNQVADPKRSDWIFLLDADEFLPFATKEDFGRALAKFGSARFLRLPWLNLVPETFDRESVLGRRLLRPPSTRPPCSIGKVAFRSSLRAVASFAIQMGNHLLEMDEKFPKRWMNMLPRRGQKMLRARYHTARTAFALYHIPIRNLDQLQEKLQKGLHSLREKNNRAGWECQHWDKIAQVVSAKGCSPEVATGVILYYDQPMESAREFSRADLIAAGYEPMTLNVARESISPLALQGAWQRQNFTAGGRSFGISRYVTKSGSISPDRDRSRSSLAECAG